MLGNMCTGWHVHHTGSGNSNVLNKLSNKTTEILEFFSKLGRDRRWVYSREIAIFLF